MIDIHSHILPGLDDGAGDLKTALEMALMAVDDGITKMIATPHIFRGGYPEGGIEGVKKAREEFIRALEENSILLGILPGAEVHISHNLVNEIKANREALVLNGSRYMFIEFPSEHIFSGVEDLIFKLKTQGIVPIIAHPERNSVFRHNPNFLYDLLHLGALTQVNQGSFSGVYGSRVQDAVFRFLEQGFVHFLATDCHNTWIIRPQLSGALRKASQIIGEDNARALVDDNPLAVVEDKEIPYMPEPKKTEKKKKSLKIKLPSFIKGKE